jgi:UDP-N-acetyl-D-galactosamine dehydrogenase
VIDIVRELRSYGAQVHVHDPLADAGECEHEYGVTLMPWEQLPAQACAIVAAVSHAEYAQMGLPRLTAKLKPGGVFTDVKSVYEPAQLAALGFNGWRL